MPNMTGQPAVLWSRKILFLYFVSVIRLTTSFTTLAEIKMLILAKISSALKNATLLLESFWPFMTKNNPFYYERCYFTHSLKDSSNCFTKRTLCFLFWKFKWKLSWCQAMFDSLTTASVSGQVARYSAKTQFSYVHHHNNTLEVLSRICFFLTIQNIEGYYSFPKMFLWDLKDWILFCAFYLMEKVSS